MNTLALIGVKKAVTEVLGSTDSSAGRVSHGCGFDPPPGMLCCVLEQDTSSPFLSTG